MKWLRSVIAWLRRKVSPEVLAIPRDKVQPPSVEESEREEAHKKIRETLAIEARKYVEECLSGMHGSGVGWAGVRPGPPPTDDEWAAAMKDWRQRL